jgi:hypothetical protein
MKLEDITAEQFDAWVDYLTLVALVYKLSDKSSADAIFTIGICLGIEFAVDRAESEKLEALVCPVSQ